jgi:hypothetical protein
MLKEQIIRLKIVLKRVVKNSNMTYTYRLSEIEDLTLEFLIEWAIHNIKKGYYEADNVFVKLLSEKLRRNEC